MRDPVARGWTPNELAKVLRVSPDKIRSWIKKGELTALNTAGPRERPRFIILPDDLEAFKRRRRVATDAAKPPKRRRPASQIDFFP